MNSHTQRSIPEDSAKTRSETCHSPRLDQMAFYALLSIDGIQETIADGNLMDQSDIFKILEN